MLIYHTPLSPLKSGFGKKTVKCVAGHLNDYMWNMGHMYTRIEEKHLAVAAINDMIVLILIYRYLYEELIIQQYQYLQSVPLS